MSIVTSDSSAQTGSHSNSLEATFTAGPNEARVPSTARLR